MNEAHSPLSPHYDNQHTLPHAESAAGTMLGQVFGGGPATPAAAAVPGSVLPSAAAAEMKVRTREWADGAKSMPQSLQRADLHAVPAACQAPWLLKCPCPPPRRHASSWAPAVTWTQASLVSAKLCGRPWSCARWLLCCGAEQV